MVLPIVAALILSEAGFRIEIQPFASFPAARVAEVRRAISETFNAEVTVRPVISLPKSAYYPPRDRYRADRLLSFLANGRSSEEKCLALTAVDISTTKGSVYDWGIFGLGTVGGRSAVVSTYRFHGRDIKKRLRLTVLHELGHTFGLPHCPNKTCLMIDAEGSIHTFDHSSGRFCPKCRAKLGSILR